jgi:hypothetical protein
VCRKQARIYRAHGVDECIPLYLALHAVGNLLAFYTFFTFHQSITSSYTHLKSSRPRKEHSLMLGMREMRVKRVCEVREDIRWFKNQVKALLHDATGWTTGWMNVYTLQPVGRPVGQPVVSCKTPLRVNFNCWE